MRKRASVFILFCLFFSLNIWSFDLGIARIYQYSPEGAEFEERDITGDLFNKVRESDRNGVLDLVMIRKRFIPKSILDAAVVSETENIDFLLYGFLKVTGNYHDFEIKLYDRKAGEIKNIFYAKNNTSGYEELIQTIADRILFYFYKTLGTARRNGEAEKEYGVIDIEFGTGYWIPFKPWSDTLSGLVAVHTSFGLTPVNPLFRWDIFRFSLGYGIGLDYSLGMNRDGFESYTFHSGRVGFPVTLSVWWHRVNRVVLGIAPLLQVDFLLQDRLYWRQVSKISSAFSLSALLGYEYVFPESRSSLGISLRFNTAFYTNILFTADSSLYYRYTFSSIRKGD